MDIDLPYGDTENVFSWEMPYKWKSEDSGFVRLVEAYGLGKGNFDELVGKNILVRDDGDLDWKYRSSEPEDYRAKLNTSTEEKPRITTRSAGAAFFLSLPFAYVISGQMGFSEVVNIIGLVALVITFFVGIDWALKY